VTAPALIPGELDHGHPCGTCRWYVIWIRRAQSAADRARHFAHAHHHVTRGADETLARRDRLRADYRAHRNSHATERGDG
jgi:hypothetical protein